MAPLVFCIRIEAKRYSHSLLGSPPSAVHSRNFPKGAQTRMFKCKRSQIAATFRRIRQMQVGRARGPPLGNFPIDGGRTKQTCNRAI